MAVEESHTICKGPEKEIKNEEIEVLFEYKGFRKACKATLSTLCLCIQQQLRSVGEPEATVSIAGSEGDEQACTFLLQRWSHKWKAFVNVGSVLEILDDDKVTVTHKPVSSPSKASGPVVLAFFVLGLCATEKSRSSNCVLNGASSAITQLAFSHHDRALIGSSGEDGSVCLWSTESQRLLTRFSQKHAGPATDVCFSPYNKLLMVSAGTDSKITCYDIQQRRSVTQISAPAALCSVTVLRDGMTLIGGGTDGKLYVYELRNVKVPSQVIEAHQSAVTCISEQLPLKSTASKPVAKDSGAQMTSEAQKQDQEPSELSSEGLVVHTPFIPPSYPNRLAAKADPQSSYMPKLVLQTPLVRDSKMGPFVTPALNAATPGIFSPLENEAGLLQTNKSTVTMAPALGDPVPVPNPDVSSIFSPLVTVSTEARSGPPASAIQSTTVRPLLLPRITTVGSSTVPLVPLSSTARPLVPVTTSMNQVSSAPSQDFPPSTALTETSLMASSVQSSIAAVQTTVSNATVVSFASQRADSVAESEESDHMILTEQNPLASLTRSAPAFQHAEAPAIQVQYLEGLIKDTAEELRNTLSVNMDLPMLCCIGSERTHGIVITERIA
eukprot:Em0013g1054a